MSNDSGDGDDGGGRDDRRVLVTGGCGYIGSALVPQLLADDRVGDVVVVDSLASGSPAAIAGTLGQDLTFYRGDIRDREVLREAMAGVDAVIHLAAITGADSTHDRREETFAVNRDGTAAVCETAGEAGVETVVFGSSCNLYGGVYETDIDETTTPDPQNPYAASKLAAEEILADAAAEYGFAGTALRMSTNYGWAPGIRFNLVVNHFVFRALTDRPLTVYGDGTNWRPFIHVQDAARAYRAAALTPAAWPRTVYNVGAATENYRIRDVADHVQAICDDRELAVSYLADEDPGPSYHVAFDRLAETNFTPEWTLPAGIQDLATRLREGPAVTGDPRP